MWSVGVITYILLGGYPPFHDDNQKELFRYVLYVLCRAVLYCVVLWCKYCCMPVCLHVLHGTSCSIVSYHVLSYHIMFYRIISYRIISYHMWKLHAMTPRCTVTVTVHTWCVSVVMPVCAMIYIITLLSTNSPISMFYSSIISVTEINPLLLLDGI